MSLQKAILLDLNGTLVMPVRVERLADLRPIDGVARAVARLCRRGFLCPVVTVQSRIEKGYFTEAEFRAWFDGFAQQMAAEGAQLHGPYVCPHRYRTACACAKPQTLLYEHAVRDLGVDLTRSYVVGDTTDDLEAGRRLGTGRCLVRVAGADERKVSSEAERLASYIGPSLTDVADWILRHEAA